MNAETQQIDTCPASCARIDIAPDNTVPSNLVADAQIKLTGKGPVGDKQHDGIITRDFQSFSSKALKIAPTPPDKYTGIDYEEHFFYHTRFADCSLALPGTRQRGSKDIATVQGVRGNQLIGYGLVVGLARHG